MCCGILVSLSPSISLLFLRKIKRLHLLSCFIVYYRHLDIRDNFSTYDLDEWLIVVLYMILLIDCIHLLHALEKYKPMDLEYEEHSNIFLFPTLDFCWEWNVISPIAWPHLQP